MRQWYLTCDRRVFCWGPLEDSNANERVVLYPSDAVTDGVRLAAVSWRAVSASARVRIARCMNYPTILPAWGARPAGGIVIGMPLDNLVIS